MGKEEDDREDPEELKPVLDRLRELIVAEEGLDVRKDENFLLRYLRCCGYDPEIAFNRMKVYYELKHDYPHWFAKAESNSSLDEAIATGYFYLLKTKDYEGKPIYVNELGCIKESKSTMPQQSQLHDFYTETILDDDATQMNGLCVIIDLNNVSWRLMKWLTPGNLRIAVKKTETLPVKKISYHVVNTNVILNMALKIILPCLSTRTKENIHIHRESWSSLHKMIDPKSLPTHYGGELDSEAYKIKINKNSEKLVGNLRLGYQKSP